MDLLYQLRCGRMSQQAQSVHSTLPGKWSETWNLNARFLYMSSSLWEFLLYALSSSHLVYCVNVEREALPSINPCDAIAVAVATPVASADKQTSRPSWFWMDGWIINWCTQSSCLVPKSLPTQSSVAMAIGKWVSWSYWLYMSSCLIACRVSLHVIRKLYSFVFFTRRFFFLLFMVLEIRFWPLLLIILH